MAGLLTAQVVAAAHHLLDHAPVPDGGADHPDAPLPHGDVEPEVAHDGRHHGALPELAVGVQLGGEHRHHLVPVHHLAPLVDTDGPVGIPVERYADVGAVPPDGVLQRLGMERPAVPVDVLAVGIDAERDHPGAELLQDLGGHFVRGTVAAIDGDREPIERQVARERALGEDVVAADGIVDAEGLPDLGSGRAERVDRVREDEPLDLRLELVGELEPGRAEELDAVVLEGIVRRGDDDPGVGAERAGEERDARGGERPDQEHVDSHGADARGHGGLEHVAREARVLADQDLVPAIRLLRHVGERAPESERDLRGHRLDVRDPAHAVRAEQLAHYRPPRGVSCSVRTSGCRRLTSRSAESSTCGAT